MYAWSINIQWSFYKTNYTLVMVKLDIYGIDIHKSENIHTYMPQAGIKPTCLSFENNIPQPSIFSSTFLSFFFFLLSVCFDMNFSPA